MSNPDKPIDLHAVAHYRNKPLSDHTLPELELIWLDLRNAEIKREEASKHEKFNKMEFPPPNPNFLILKSKIEEEIASRG